MNPSSDNRPIVTPVKTDNTPDLGPIAVMAATLPDYQLLEVQLGLDRNQTRPLFTTKLAVGSARMAGLSLCGPFIGAPHGAMILETLIAWGAHRFIFMGWCGSIAKHVHNGNIILPTGALVDEGTSRHYGHKGSGPVSPAESLLEKTKEVLVSTGTPYQEGLIWTTDAAFRETVEAVKSFQAKGVLAVEMELSALFSVGKFHGIEIVGLLVVSDELSSLKWKPGFKSNPFKEDRQAAAKTVQRLIEALL